MRRFFPKEDVDSIYSIDFGRLWDAGIRGLIIDIDNTLETFDIPDPGPKVVALIDDLRQMGFGIVLLSNNGRRRVERFSASLDCPHIWKARKPSRKGIRRALALLGLAADQAAIIGDQLFTDCYGGNRMGMHTILTAPIAKRDEWTVWLKRLPEKIVLRAYERSKKS